MDADNVSSADGAEFAEALKRRNEEIDQLHEREQQLAQRLGRGSTPPQAAQARESAEHQHMHAVRAHERAVERLGEAAQLHDRAAEVLDEHGRPERAQTHREAAEHDRDAP